MYKDYHQVLGVDKNATPDQIKAAYKKLAKQYHPDVNKGDGAEDNFKAVNEAYQKLSDPNYKEPFNPFKGNQRGRTRNPFNPFEGMPNFNNFRNDNWNSYDYHYNPPVPQRGKDISANSPLTVKEAYFGCKKKVEYYRNIKCNSCTGNNQTYISCTNCGGHGMVEHILQQGNSFFQSTSVCPKCKGSGQILEHSCLVCGDNKVIKKKETIEINIPKFSTIGTKLRVKGFGEMGVNNGDYGDFYLIVNDILPWESFYVEQGMLQTKLYINPIEAMLGIKTDIKLPSGENIEIEVEPMTRDKEMVFIDEQGLFKLPGSTERGFLALNIEYMYPTELTEKQIELLDSFMEIERLK